MKRRFVWLAVASLVVIAAWFGMAFRPGQAKLKDLRTDVASTRQQVSAQEAKLQRLLALQSNKDGARDAAQKLAGSVPVDPKVSDFILQVQDAANVAGIDFLSISPSLPAVPADAVAAATASAAPSTAQSSNGTGAAATPAAPPTRLRSITVSIKADGEYFAIENFTLRMEQLARALRIDEFSLAASQEENGGNKLSANIKLQMFMLAPQAAATTAPAATNQGT